MILGEVGWATTGDEALTWSVWLISTRLEGESEGTNVPFFSTSRALELPCRFINRAEGKVVL